ncbi:MAG: NAD(P)-dependent oxidoreductase [Bdellovibrionales bacterium]|nr:NAD(P)-dependent oxidoreductase [Bdellovibrionales bacterium]
MVKTAPKTAKIDLAGKTIWITGSTGYLGRSFLAEWGERFPGAKPVLLVRREPKTRRSGFEYAVAKHPSGDFTYEDLRALRESAAPAAILHFATHFQNAYEPADAEKMIAANVGFPTRLLEACRGLPELRFLNFGSFYSHADGTADGPLTFYAASKRAFESFLNFYGETPGWRAITLKVYDTYGPGDDRPKLVPKWIEILRSGEEMKVSPGGQKLSFVHVDDVADAVARAIELLFGVGAEWKSGHRIYQLPATEKLADLPTLKEIAGEFERAAGKKLPIRFGALPYRANEIMEPSLDFPVLPGWKPKIDLVTGFRRILKGK